MKSLIIDTSSDISYVILTDKKNIIFFKKINKFDLSEKLMLTIDDILKKNNLDISDLSYIATSFGPGAFNSLRVGATICKTFNFTKKVPLVGYLSLKAYTPKKNGNFLSFMDGKSDGIYGLLGTKKNDKITWETDAKLYSFDDALKILENVDIAITPDIYLKEKFKNLKEKFEDFSFNPYRLTSLTDSLFSNKKIFDYSNFKLIYLKGPTFS